MSNRRKWLTLPGVAVLLVFAVAPLFIMLGYSFINESGQLTLENYAHFFSRSFYLKLTWQTIVLSLIVTVISLIIAYPLAYIMARKLRGTKNMVLMLLMIPFFTNQLVRVYSWLVFLQDDGIFAKLLQSLHLIDGPLGILYTQTAVVIGLVHAFFPYMVITLYMSMEKIDPSLLEAGRSLGASPVRNFFRVTLPLSRPGMISGIMLVFVPCLGSFVEPRILGGTNGTVIGTVIEDQFFEIYGWNFGASVAFILLALVMASMALLRRWGKGAES